MASGLMKQLVTLWKHKRLLLLHRRRSFYSNNKSTTVISSSSNRSLYPPPAGSIFVFVGSERKRFSVPVRFLNLTIFKCLLWQAAEEFGHGVDGCLILPCEVGLFEEIMKRVKKDERKYGKLSLEEFANVVSFESFHSHDEEENIVAFTPLLGELIIAA